jgi:hypothetical protein
MSVEATASTGTKIGRVHRNEAGSATGSRRDGSGSTIPRNSSKARTVHHLRPRPIP